VPHVSKTLPIGLIGSALSEEELPSRYSSETILKCQQSLMIPIVGATRL